jgi:hypothetical protein
LWSFGLARPCSTQRAIGARPPSNTCNWQVLDGKVIATPGFLSEQEALEAVGLQG